MRPRNVLPQGYIYNHNYFKRERNNTIENITWILGKARTANHTYARAREVKDTEVKTIRTLQLVRKNLFICVYICALEGEPFAVAFFTVLVGEDYLLEQFLEHLGTRLLIILSACLLYLFLINKQKKRTIKQRYNNH